MRIPGFSMRGMGWMPKGKHPGLFLKSLFLIFVLALSSVPVFQAAHALTHVDPVHETHLGDGSGSSEFDGELDDDIDRVCIDCLALTGFSIIFCALAIFFRNPTRPRSPLQDGPEQHLSSIISLYSTRAPPRG
jgi:hypothetical protein